jgi:Lar family restriction alleviation protein
MSDENIKLKPCPFCDDYEVRIGERGTISPYYFVECDNCFAEGPASGTESLACINWNRRVGDDK